MSMKKFLETTYQDFFSALYIQRNEEREGGGYPQYNTDTETVQNFPTSVILPEGKLILDKIHIKTTLIYTTKNFGTKGDWWSRQCAKCV